MYFAQRFGLNLMKRFAKYFGHRSQNNSLGCFVHCVRILFVFTPKKEAPSIEDASFFGAKGGIRTLGRLLAEHTISSRAP